MSPFRRTLMSVALCWSAIAAAADSASAPDRIVQFDVTAQSMEQALTDLGAQAGLRIVFFPETVKGLMASRIKGAYTPEAALKVLLADSDLKYSFIDTRTVAISSSPVGEESAPTASTLRNQMMRLTQSESKQQQTESVESQDSSKQTSTQSPSDGSASADIQEIVVTAQKREERLQDVPISISVLSGANLDRSSVESVMEALSSVPGVSTTTGNASALLGGMGSTIVIRGVNPGSGAGTTAFYLDSIPFSAAGGPVFGNYVPDANAYDLERVEVLRGPQGTLYGLSAANGVVRVLTKDADLSKFEGKGRGAVSHTEFGEMGYRADMAVNVPVVTDRLAFRAVAGYQRTGGWIDRPAGEDVNSAESNNIRLKVAAKPTEDLSIGVLAWRSRADSAAGPISADGRTSTYTWDTPAKEDFDAYNLKLGYDSSFASITSVTSHLDHYVSGFVDFTVIGIPNSVVNQTSDLEVFSEELIVNSTHAGPLRWTLGGMYRSGSVESYALRRNFLTGLLSPPYLAPNIQRNDSDSLAVFGEATFALFGGKLELTGGLRYFEDRITAREISFLSVAGGVPPTGLLTLEKTFTSVTPRFVASWHPSGDTTLYASYGEGFRSGAHQTFGTIRQAPQFPAAESDLLKNYELGIKGGLWNGRVSYEAAAFYMDWQDIQTQLSILIDPVFFVFAGGVVNGAKADGVGFEAGLAVEPIDGLTFSGNFSWNDLSYAEDVFSGIGGIVPAARVIAEGERLSGSPELTAAAGVDYLFPLGATWKGRLGASANYMSKVSAGLVSSGAFIYTDSVLIGRTSFAVESARNWTATLFVDNFNNENGFTAGDTLSLERRARIRPRTIGLQLDCHFGGR